MTRRRLILILAAATLLAGAWTAYLYWSHNLRELPRDIDFIYAVEDGDLVAAERMLVDDPSLAQDVVWWVARNDAAALDLLVRFDVDLNAVDHMGRTPLQAAADAGRADIVRRLKELGATESPR